MLCAVGHAHAVNPGKELAALAKGNDWPVWQWHLPRETGSKASARLSTGIHQIEGQA
jgi:hypothetical protein